MKALLLAVHGVGLLLQVLGVDELDLVRDRVPRDERGEKATSKAKKKAKQKAKQKPADGDATIATDR